MMKVKIDILDNWLHGNIIQSFNVECASLQEAEFIAKMFCQATEKYYKISKL